MRKTSAAVSIRNRILATMAEAMVTCLRQAVVMEIVDLDEVTTKEKVHTSVMKALGQEASSNADVKVTGIWGTRSGQQMATVSVPIAHASRLTHIRIGWLQYRVRPHSEQPQRCYKCHGFGHGTRQCTSPDLTGACRRCGQEGHVKRACTTGEDRCVACDRAGLSRVAHRTGSCSYEN